MRIRERFNPRAPCGARRYLPQGIRYPHKISTHAPLAGRDGDGGRGSDAIAYFNPRAPCGARLVPALPARPLINISTHAPLAGRDERSEYPCTRDTYFNPRAPCGARRLPQRAPQAALRFQPTRPLRGATGTSSKTRGRGNISTHAPLAGRDDYDSWIPTRQLHYFNPRAPCGARPGRH